MLAVKIRAFQISKDFQRAVMRFFHEIFHKSDVKFENRKKTKIVK